VVDFITHTIEDGTLYFTSVSRTVRHGSDVFAVGAELSDWQSGDFHIIREYVAHSEVGLLTFTGEWRQSQIRLLESG
jgi:hypothetical protein